MGCHFLLQCMKMKSESEVAQSCLTLRLLVTPWTVAYQAPPSMGLSRQEYWSGVPFPSPIHESESEVAQSCPTLRLLATPWTAAYQAPPSMGFSRQEYWGGLPFPSPVRESEVAQLWPTLRLLATPWTAAYQAPPSMQEYLHGKYSLQARVLEWGAIIVTSSLLMKKRKVLKLRMAPGPSSIKCIWG